MTTISKVSSAFALPADDCFCTAFNALTKSASACRDGGPRRIASRKASTASAGAAKAQRQLAEIAKCFGINSSTAGVSIGATDIVPVQAVSEARDARPMTQVDDSKASSCYANFCRVTGTPEEIIIDFGLNSQPFGTPTTPIAIAERIICNYYTAKRMLAALNTTVQRHEAVCGVLETDVQKRPGSRRT